MLLKNLIHAYNPALPLGNVPEIEITGVQEDSRQVRHGELFVSRKSFGPRAAADLKTFIADAKLRGAAAVITSEKITGIGLPQIVIGDPSPSSMLANIFHGRPSGKVAVLGVTGTNGKTTTAYLIRHLLKSHQHRCGMVGTVQIDDGKQTVEASMTTPDAITLAGLIASMRDKGCRGCAMEVSSHALDQDRAAGIRFAGAGFTNLTGDHLDYHQTMEAYAAAKAKLFTSLDPEAVAVINADDPFADRMIQDCPARLIRFSMIKTVTGKTPADYRARDISVNASGTTFTLHTPDGRAEVQMSLIGRHNIENALCAAALVGETFHYSVQQLAAALKNAAGAPGRLQPVRCGQPFAVLVDYAHTDDALENVLTALRSVAKGKLRVLFGCGGDRDRTKRPRMAKIANKLADVVYLTSDNPRTEEPEAILKDVAAGFPASNRCVLQDVDRRTAIEKILSDAEPDDVVLIAGKGHEDYQIIGTTKHHFDDVEECTRVLGSLSASAA